jgi:hypothetical protein
VRWDRYRAWTGLRRAERRIVELYERLARAEERWGATSQNARDLRVAVMKEQERIRRHTAVLEQTGGLPGEGVDPRKAPTSDPDDAVAKPAPSYVRRHPAVRRRRR